MQQSATRHILSWAELRLAVFISIVISLVVFTIFFSDLVYSLIQRQISLRILIEDVGGLKTGAPVWLQGVTAGSVQKIDITSNSEIVDIKIGKKFQPYLYQDASAEVKAVGLLGSKYVELIRGDKSSGPIKPGQTIKGKLVDPLKSMDENLSMTIARISLLLDHINKGEGTAGALIRDTSLAIDLKKTTENLRLLLEEIRKDPKKFFKIEVF